MLLHLFLVADTEALAAAGVKRRFNEYRASLEPEVRWP